MMFPNTCCHTTLSIRLFLVASGQYWSPLRPSSHPDAALIHLLVSFNLSFLLVWHVHVQTTSFRHLWLRANSTITLSLKKIGASTKCKCCPDSQNVKLRDKASGLNRPRCWDSPAALFWVRATHNALRFAFEPLIRGINGSNKIELQ